MRGLAVRCGLNGRCIVGALSLSMHTAPSALYVPRFLLQEEGFSEEPTLTSALAAAFVEGSHGSLGLPPGALQYTQLPCPGISFHGDYHTYRSSRTRLQMPT